MKPAPGSLINLNEYLKLATGVKEWAVKCLLPLEPLPTQTLQHAAQLNSTGVHYFQLGDCALALRGVDLPCFAKPSPDPRKHLLFSQFGKLGDEKQFFRQLLTNAKIAQSRGKRYW